MAGGGVMITARNGAEEAPCIRRMKNAIWHMW